MRKAIVNRISRRKFQSQPITMEDQVKINKLLEGYNQESGLSMTFIEDGSKAFSSIKKSYGMFSGVRSVIVLKGPSDDINLVEKIGYYGEAMVLDLTDMGLGTCWVAGTYDKGVFSVGKGEELVCVIPVGYVDSPSLKEKVLRASISKNRKSARERMTGYDNAPIWVKEAMEAVRLAPSAVNKQKPMFHYENGEITADVVNDYAMDLIDLGIAKKHFEEAAHGKFAFGLGAKFEKE